MHKHTNEAFQQIDAGLFSGDEFYNQGSLDKLKHFLVRWEGQVPTCQEMIDSPEDVENSITNATRNRSEK